MSALVRLSALAPLAMGFLLGIVGPAHADITTGLVTHYKLDGNLNYSAGIANMSGTGTYVTGKSGQGFHLDGSFGSDLSSPDSGTAAGASIAGITDLTYAFWFKKEAGGDTDFLWNGTFRLVSVVGTQIRFNALSWSTTSGQWTTSGANIQNDKWYHVVVTYSYSATGNTPQIYINGKLQTIVQNWGSGGTYTAPGTGSSITFKYGNNGSTDTVRYKGAFDDIRLYRRILTAADVQELYHKTKVRSGQIACDASHAGVMLYNYDEAVLQYCNGTSWIAAGKNAAALTTTWTQIGGTCGLRADGSAWCWGGNSKGEVGNNSTSSPQTTPARVTDAAGTGYWSNWTQISGEGNLFSCGLRADGSAWCWGGGSLALGAGIYPPPDPQITPIQVSNEFHSGYWTDWVQVEPIYVQACGLRSNGTAWCWGVGGSGCALGYGSGTCHNTYSPVQVKNDDGTGYWSDWTKLAGSGSNGSVCGLRNGGEAWCWGRNTDGQLGNGTTISSPTGRPVRLGTAGTSTLWSDWTHLSIGTDLGCGILAGGTAWCWGQNGLGQGGGSSTTPVQVGTAATSTIFTDWVQIDVRWSNGCGVRSNGTAWCWGFGPKGQRGDGSTLAWAHTPVQVKDSTGTGYWTDWVQIDAQWERTCGLRSNGTAWCWGRGNAGQRGDGATTSVQTLPVQVSNVGFMPQQSACANPTGTVGEIDYNAAQGIMQYCNGNKWVVMGPRDAEIYQPTPINFDGWSHLRRGGDLTGNADSKMFTGSFWFRKTANFASVGCQYVYGNGLGQVQFPSGDRFSLYMRNSGGTLVLSGSSAASFTGDQNWHHVMFSVDMSNTAKRHIYVDDVNSVAGWYTYLNDVIDFTATDHGIANNGSGTCRFSGDLADVWVDPGTYIDLSVQANREKFIKNGKPVFLGTDGSLPTGAPPKIFLSGDKPTWQTNDGMGGGFTVTGTLGDGQSPVPVGSSGDYTTGLIGHWQLNETSGSAIADSVGSSNGMWEDNTDAAITTEAVAGKVGGALDFNNGDWAEVNIPGAVFNNLSPMTACAWLKVNTIPGANSLIVGKTGGASYGAEGWVLAANNPAGNHYFFVSNRKDYKLTNGTINFGNWEHVCATWDGTDGAAGILLYVNGAPDNTGISSTNTGVIDDSGLGLQICANDAASSICDNEVDDVRIYNRVLSAAEITALYDSTLLTCSSPPGTPGEMVYNADHHIMQFCNGRMWVGVGATP